MPVFVVTTEEVMVIRKALGALALRAGVDQEAARLCRAKVVRQRRKLYRPEVLEALRVVSASIEAADQKQQRNNVVQFTRTRKLSTAHLRPPGRPPRRRNPIVEVRD